MAIADAHWNTSVTLIGALSLAFAALVVRRSTFYRELINKEIASARFHAIDGLRGYLAIGVVLHHLALNYQYYRVANLSVPSTWILFLGDGSVAFFFMITAFLFWNRAMDEDGRMDAAKFFTSRLRRTVPMYFLAVGLTVVATLAYTGFHLEVPLFEVSRQILSWFLFTIPGMPNINGFETWRINGVAWSLAWEWGFYLLLPFMALFSRPRYRWYWAASMATYIWLFSKTQLEWFFLYGCVAAMLTRNETVKQLAATRTASMLALAGIAATMVCAPTIHTPLAAALMLVPFIIFSGGNTLFGLLTARPARLLGLLSYSIYLSHAPILFVLSRLVDRYASIKAIPEIWYWAVGLLVAMISIVASGLTYCFIEKPFLRSSRRTQPHLETAKVQPS